MDISRALVVAVSASASVLVSASSRAAGEPEPLLVVVETAPGAGLDPGAVRRAIGAELGTPVVAPGEKAAARAARVLVVAIDGRQIAMSLRNAADESVARTINAPGDRTADLRVLGWLAGNLVRDQVSGPIAATAFALASVPDAPLPGEAPVRGAAERGASVEPSPMSAPAVPPAPARSAPQSIRAAEVDASPRGSGWSVTACLLLEALEESSSSHPLLSSGKSACDAFRSSSSAFP